MPTKFQFITELYDFYYNKAKAENTTGGIVFESACGRQARGGQDCDGWEENG